MSESRDSEHSLERDQRPLCNVLSNNNLIYDRLVHQIFQAPAHVGQVDAVHCSAHANQGRQKVNLLLWMLFLQAIDEVELGTNRPLRAARCFPHRIDYFARRSGDISDVVHLLWALGVN